MIHTTTVALAPQEVIARAKAFFAERIPHMSAFVEKEGPHFLVLRGQGAKSLPSAWSRLRARGEGEGG